MYIHLLVYVYVRMYIVIESVTVQCAATDQTEHLHLIGDQ